MIKAETFENYTFILGIQSINFKAKRKSQINSTTFFEKIKDMIT